MRAKDDSDVHMGLKREEVRARGDRRDEETLQCMTNDFGISSTTFVGERTRLGLRVKW